MNSKMLRRSNVPKELYVVVMYTEPYEMFSKAIFNAKDITHFVGRKPADETQARPQWPVEHPVMGFTPGQLYLLKTKAHSEDGQFHHYHVYIGGYSNSKTRLQEILLDQNRAAKELVWPEHPEAPTEPESGTENEDSSSHRPAQIQNAVQHSKDTRLAKQGNHINRLLNSGHFDMPRPSVSDSGDKENRNQNTEEVEDPWIQLFELRKKFERQQEELRSKEKEIEAKDKNFDSLFKKLESLQSDVNLIKDIQSDVKALKETISSGSFNSGSQSSVASSNREDLEIVVTAHGVVKMPLRFKRAIEKCYSKTAFFKYLVEGCFGADAPKMRINKPAQPKEGQVQPVTKQIPKTWITDALVFYGDWLKSNCQHDKTKQPLSETEISAYIQTFNKDLGASIHSFEPRGINRVRQQAREENLDRATTLLMLEEYRASHPKKPRKNTAEATPSAVPTPVPPQHAPGQLTPINYEGGEGHEQWHDINHGDLPAGPSTGGVSQVLAAVSQNVYV